MPGCSHTASTAASSASIVITISASAASRGEEAIFARPRKRPSALPLRLYTVSAWPPSISRAAISRPIWPRPMKPTFMSSLYEDRGNAGRKALRDLVANARLPVLRVRMRGEEFRRAGAARGLRRRFHDPDHRPRIVARLGSDADAERIGLDLVVAPVAHVEQAPHHLADLRGA